MTHQVKRNLNKEVKSMISRWVSRNVETSSVGVIRSVKEYASGRMVDVLPLTMERDNDGTAIVPDIIYRCPVILQGCSEGYISYPLKVGDKVILGFTKGSIGEYLASSTSDQYLPVDYGAFGANDAFVIGYIGQPSVDLEVSADNFEVVFKDSKLTITPTNDIMVENPEASVQLLEDGTITIQNGSSNIVLNPDGTITANDCLIDASGNVTTAGGTDLDQLKADFDSLKVSYLAHGSGNSNHNPPVPAPL